MPGVKTAISLEKKLFEQVNKLARDMHVSRSKLFSLAIKDFLKKQESKELLAQINKAYADHTTSEEEQKAANAMRSKQRKIVEQETW